MKKTECGSGGISYAIYFVVMMICIILYSYTIFEANLYVIQSDLENGLHIVESAVITANQSKVVNSERVDEFEKELARMKIVTTSTFSESVAVEEQSQVNLLGKCFEEYFREQFKLDGSNVQGGTLEKLCGKGTELSIVGDVLIYEPIYELSVTRTETDNQGTNTEGYVPKSYEFTSEYLITGWIRYSLLFENNSYSSFTKEVLDSTPILKGGGMAEGATIEADIGISFRGLNNIFADISEKKMFADEVKETKYDAIVSQSMDVVIASQDSRKQQAGGQNGQTKD